VTVLVVAGCVGTPPGPSATPSVGGASPSVTAAASPSADVPLGGTLRVALATPVGALDPRAAEAEPLVVSQLFEGLVAQAAGGPRPALATKWSVAPDGRTWTFTLRDGVAFHDGAPLDAAAVVKALSLPDDPLIATVAAADPRTVTLVTRAPSGTLLAALALPRYAITAPGTPLAGTGPFRIAVAGDVVRPLVLERNPTYWRTDASGRRLPYLDRLSLTTVTDPAQRLAALRSGTADLATDIAPADLGAVRADPSLQVIVRPETTVLYLGLNLSSPGLDDLRVRQAIAQSLDPKGLVERSYSGAGTTATQLPPPGLLGYDDSVTEFARQDIGAARKLLADAKRTPFQLDLWYLADPAPGRPDLRRVAEAIAADLAPAGVSVDTKTIDPITFAASVRDNRYPAWIGLATPVPFDPDGLLGGAFIPPVVNGQDQPTDAGAWTNPEVAGLLRKARAEPDQTKRAELYKQVSKIVQREIPRIPLVWSAPPLAATKKVRPGPALFAELALGR
jgi:peptide/nickel transport system substrate-binding protein